MLTSIIFCVLASPPLCQHLDLEAEIDIRNLEIRGHLECKLNQKGSVSIANYPHVLTKPLGLNDINRQWFYPEGFSPASMQIRYKGRTLASDCVWIELGDFESEQTIRLEFITKIPRRTGLMGIQGSIFYLLGGWHPALGSQNRIPEQLISYKIRVPYNQAGFVGLDPFTQQDDRQRLGVFRGQFLPILSAPHIEVKNNDVAVLVIPQSKRPRLTSNSSYRSFKDISQGRDTITHQEILQTVKNGYRRLQDYPFSPPFPILLVLAPLREKLVEKFSGGLVISDRAFQLLRFERLLKFHRLRILRDYFGFSIQKYIQKRENKIPSDLVADIIASAFCEEMATDQYGGAEYAPDILETFAVIPEIDSLIFAPQIMFLSTYFHALDESSPIRWHLDDFFHKRPRGKLLYEKLIDRFGYPAVQKLVSHYLQTSQTWLELESPIASVSIEEVMQPWLGPLPQIDYRLGEIQSDESSIRIEVVIQGPDWQYVKEPVLVEVIDAHSAVHRQSRIGPGLLVFKAPGPPKKVELDPEHRLIESYHVPGEAPRFNNRKPPRYRFLLNNIASLIAVTNKELTLAADFSLRRIHDLRYRTDFYTLYSPSSFGGATTFSYAFGEQRTPLYLTERIGLSALYERLRSEKGVALPGNQGTLLAFYRYDNRLSPYWSFEGKGLTLRLAAALGQNSRQIQNHYWHAGAGAFYIFPLAFGHAILGRIRADVIFGKPPKQHQLSLGGRYRGGRGFERDEVRGNRRFINSVEYRHLLTADARTNLGGLVTWTRFEGAFFGDAVYLPIKRLGCQQRMFYDVGYGVRFIGDVLGVSPAELAVDIGIPLNRCPDELSRGPISVYLAFVQSFSSF